MMYDGVYRLRKWKWVADISETIKTAICKLFLKDKTVESLHD